MRRKLDYSKLPKMGSWLHQYMSTFQGTETPSAYDFWCGVWVLSNVIGRGMPVLRPHAPVFLNTYVLLCAEAGVTRKSTAIKYAEELLRSVAATLDISIWTGGGAAAFDTSFMVRMERNKPCNTAVVASELVTVLGRTASASGMTGKLTDLYDCPNFTHRAELVPTYTTMLAASTPQWLLRAVDPNVVEGGFTSRCLFIIEDTPKQLVAWPEERSGTHEHHANLVNGLRNIRHTAVSLAAHTGGIRTTAAAIEHFTGWYNERAPERDPYLISFGAREDHHILRLAAILSASEGSWEIGVHHVQQATAAIAHVKHTSGLLFGAGLATTATYALVGRIRDSLVASGRSGISQGALGQLVRRHGTRAEISLVLQVMHELGYIQKFTLDTNVRGNPAVMYRATKSIATPSSMDKVLETIHPTEA